MNKKCFLILNLCVSLRHYIKSPKELSNCMKDIFPQQYSPVHQHLMALSAFGVNTVGFSKEKLGWVT